MAKKKKPVKKTVKKVDPDRMTAADVARLFGVSYQAVGNWHRRDEGPRNDDGTYNLAEVIAWRMERIAESAKPEPVPPPTPEEKLTDEQRRIQAAKAEQAELDLAERKGEVMLRDEVIQREVTIARAFRSSLERLPGTMAARLQGKKPRQIAAELKKEIEQILRELSQ